MDSKQQNDGELRVRDGLIDPLIKRGLSKPKALTNARFDDMVDDLCAKLAYMTELSLAALAEQVAANPAGSDKDRLPIANVILEWAARIQPPSDDGSPLVRAVFAAQLGRDAIAEGWGPELLAQIKRDRRWPNGFVVTKIKEGGLQSHRRFQRLDNQVERGEELGGDDAAWHKRRRDAMDKCARIVALVDGAEVK